MNDTHDLYGAKAILGATEVRRSSALEDISNKLRGMIEHAGGQRYQAEEIANRLLGHEPKEARDPDHESPEKYPSKIAELVFLTQLLARRMDSVTVELTRLERL